MATPVQTPDGPIHYELDVAHARNLPIIPLRIETAPQLAAEHVPTTLRWLLPLSTISCHADKRYRAEDFRQLAEALTARGILLTPPRATQDAAVVLCLLPVSHHRGDYR